MQVLALISDALISSQCSSKIIQLLLSATLCVPCTGGVVLNTLIRYDNLSNPQLTFDMQAFSSSGVSALARVIVNILKVSVNVPIFPQNVSTHANKKSHRLVYCCG